MGDAGRRHQHHDRATGRDHFSDLPPVGRTGAGPHRKLPRHKRHREGHDRHGWDTQDIYLGGGRGVCQEKGRAGEIDLENLRAEFAAEDEKRERRAMPQAVAEAKEFRGHLERAGISYTTLLELEALRANLGSLGHGIPLLGFERGEGWPDGT